MSGGDWVDALAGVIGAPGPAVRLLVSILMGKKRKYYVDDEMISSILRLFFDWVEEVINWICISILFYTAYPFAIFHRLFLHAKSPIAQHLFFIAAGSYIGYFNYGRLSCCI